MTDRELFQLLEPRNTQQWLEREYQHETVQLRRERGGRNARARRERDMHDECW